jgi:hypothetical protein
MEKKRAGPAQASPVSHHGVRYEVVRGGKGRGLGQNGGYIAAYDEKTNKELWILKVYDVVYDGDMEPDKQDVLITGLSVSGGPGRLTIENERGGRYAVDLKDRTVTAL